MTQRYIDLSFDDATPRSFGGFDNENEATVIRLKVLTSDAKYYLEIERACGKHDKYCSNALPVADGYATFEIHRDLTHETLYVQGVMKVDGVCRKTARVRVGFSRSINALDELPESHPSWADSVGERIDSLEIGMKEALTYTPQTLTTEQQKQARQNIGALDVNAGTTPVDIDVTLLGRGENIVYMKNGWLKPCPADADDELVYAYRRLSLQVTAQSQQPISSAMLSVANGIYLLYQNGLTSADATIMPTSLNENRYAIWTISINNNKHYVRFTVYGIAYSHFCNYCVEDNVLVSENFSRAIYSVSSGVGAQTNVKQFRMSANPTEDMHIATKQYVDNAKVEAQQLGLTAATPGQIIKVKAVQDGKPTEWEAVDMPGGEVWEKIADVDLRQDTAWYVLADFAMWRKAKVIMRRPAYIKGLEKNVWCKVKEKNNASAEFYNCGYIGYQYGYIYWDFSVEVGNTFISSTTLRNNNVNSPESVLSTSTLTPLNLSPMDCELTLAFIDTSMIQVGDKVTVIGVRR